MNKSFHVVALLLIALYACKSSKHELKVIRAVQLTSRIPVGVPGAYDTMNNSYEIFYYDSLTMYKFEFGYDSFTNNQLIKHAVGPNYFVFNNDSSFGYSYYRILRPGMTEGRVSKDSLLGKNGFSPLEFDSAFNGRKPDSVFTDQDKDLVQVYNIDGTVLQPAKSVYYLYFSKKFSGLTDYFFSRSRADVDGKKLFRVRIVMYPTYYPASKTTVPQREFLYEMTETPTTDSAEILGYFDRYKRDIATK